MRPRLSVSAKVILLVLLPLCVQLAFLIEMACLQRGAEEELRQSVKAKKTTEALNSISGDVFDIASRFSTHEKIEEFAADDEQYQELWKRSRDHYAELKKLAADNAELYTIVLASERACSNLFALVHELKDVIGDTRPTAQLHRKMLWRKMRKEVKEILYVGLVQAAEKQKKAAQASMERQTELRELLQQSAVAMGIVNVVLALILAVYLTRSISRRLAILNDNTYRFASGVPLNPVLSGADEIARLDQTFHKMAEELDEATRKEREAQMLRKQMVAMITHDLRTPLSTLGNIMEFLTNGAHAQLDEKGRGYIDIGKRNVNRMSALVNDLLDIERIDAGQMELQRGKILLDESFDACAANLAPLAEAKGVALKFEPARFVVSGDEEKIDRVLVNLIANAIKFSPEGAQVNVSAAQQDGVVCVTVQDQGKGIPQDKLEDVFKIFHRVKDETSDEMPGSGLGLSICKSFVELHGGKIWVESAPGAGTKFIFTLPSA
ncbi:MAG TPA: HAMP domain-containing sensor histidine kinase [Candidatus Obscuribacterales bacterium]